MQTNRTSSIFAYILVICGTIVFIASCKNSTQGEYESHHSSFAITMEQSDELFESGHYNEALLLLDSSYKQSYELSISDKYDYYSRCYAIYFSKRKDMINAQLYADSMLDITEKIKNKSTMPAKYLSAYYKMGDLMLASGEYKIAFGYYHKARVQASDSCALGLYDYKLAMALYKQEKYDEAAKLFKLAFKNYGDCEQNYPIFIQRQEIMDNIALCYYNMHKLDSAEIHYKNALAYIDSNSSGFSNPKAKRYANEARGVIYDNLGSLAYAKGDTVQAEQNFRKNISIYNSNGYSLYTNIGTRLKLARLFLDTRRMRSLDSAMSIIQQGIDSLDYLQQKVNWYELRWKYYVAQKNVSASLQSLEDYRHLKDSAESVSTVQSQANVGVLINNIEQENEINLLMTNNELKRNYLFISLIATILSLVIVILVFRNWRKSNKDVTKLSYLNEQVKEQNDKLENVLKDLEDSVGEKDRVMKAMAHDIRNPVAAISSLIDLFIADAENLSDDAREMLDFMKESCSDALTLSTEIIDATEPEILRKADTELTDMQILAANSIKLLSFRAIEKNQTIVLNSGNVTQKIRVNKEKISRVINNLIGNALKFSHAGSEIGVELQQKKNEILISVHDTGIGIPDEIKDAVFDMFTNAKRPGTAGEKPFGLGLSICKQIIVMHGGKLWFESVPGSGTSVYVSLPIDSEPA